MYRNFREVLEKHRWRYIDDKIALEETINLIKKLYKEPKVPGKDCTCMAYGRCECGCGADWSDNNDFNSAIDLVIKILKEE